MPISMGFFRLEISESNLPKQIGIQSLPIQIDCQNIANSLIVAHNKIKLKFLTNCVYIDTASSKNYFCNFRIFFDRKISQQKLFWDL